MASIIDKPWIMSRDQVKTMLQISVTDYDTLIDTYLPIVTDDIEFITNNNFVVNVEGDLTDASAVITNTDTTRVFKGAIVSTKDFVNAVVTDIDQDIESITTDTASSITEEDVTVKINLFPTAKKPVAAQMVWYNIQKYTADTALDVNAQSERWGNYNYTLADSDSGSVAGYPKSIIKGLAEITAVRFC